MQFIQLILEEPHLAIASLRKILLIKINLNIPKDFCCKLILTFLSMFDLNHAHLNGGNEFTIAKHSRNSNLFNAVWLFRRGVLRSLTILIMRDWNFSFYKP